MGCAASVSAAATSWAGTSISSSSCCERGGQREEGSDPINPRDEDEERHSDRQLAGREATEEYGRGKEEGGWGSGEDGTEWTTRECLRTSTVGGVTIVMKATGSPSVVAAPRRRQRWRRDVRGRSRRRRRCGGGGAAEGAAS
jgi:hypothetical protein